MITAEVRKVDFYEIKLAGWKGEEYIVWEKFCANLNRVLINKEGISTETLNDQIIRLVKSQDTKAIIQEVGQKHNIEIKFEEKEKKKEEKWIPIHEIAIELLEEVIIDFRTIAELYARGGKVPKKGIPALLKRFEAALSDSGGHLNEIIEKAIANLKEQQEEEEE